MQCPYCMPHEGGHGIKLPRSTGAYRVSVIHKNILIFKCWKCAKVFKMIMRDDKKFLWSNMTRKEHDDFKKDNYKGGKDKQ
jgi:hypothetical protein